MGTTPWSNNPNAPQITDEGYFFEKAYFAGALLNAIFYGVVVVLFFRCMSALLDPVNRINRGIRWPLVAHTLAMFSFATVYTGMYLNLQSISFVDNPLYPGDDGLRPGPLGYEEFIYNLPISYVAHIAFMLNTWLADGLLLYRCYIIYAMNYWVIAFPCLMYLASFVTGIVFMYYQIALPTTKLWPSVANSFRYPFFSISPALNIILTFTIVTRLIWHRKNIQSAMGASAGTASGLYKAIATVLVESCALYAASFILFMGAWGSGSPTANIFFPIVAETQVIAPFLIIYRAANRRALTSTTMVSGVVDSIRFKNRTDPTSYNEKDPNQFGVGVGMTTESHTDSSV